MAKVKKELNYRLKLSDREMQLVQFAIKRWLEAQTGSGVGSDTQSEMSDLFDQLMHP